MSSSELRYLMPAKNKTDVLFPEVDRVADYLKKV